MAIVFLLTILVTQSARAQTYTVLHNFTGDDGYLPASTLVFDRTGNLYGTTQASYPGDGTVFQLRHIGSGWVLNTLHRFTGSGGDGDGANPVDYGGLAFGPDGTLYGTTVGGGLVRGGVTLGTTFRIQPPASSCRASQCPWLETVLYEFAGPPNDGEDPTGNVVFDSAGNIYGTTQALTGPATVFKMTYSSGGWTESVIPTSYLDPYAGVVLDSSGNLYGSSAYGGDGSIFQLVPSVSGWTQNILHVFTGSDGTTPIGGVILDQSGNLYGSTSHGGALGGGTVFELSFSGGTWTLNTLYNFSGGGGPQSSLTMDAAGNLYGTTERSGNGVGSVFRLSRSGDGWTFTDLHDFSVIGNGGTSPIGGVTLDASGNLYGTTSEGGTNGAGLVWEITP